MAELNGRYEVVELRLGSVKDNRVVNGQLLRSVRVAAMAATAAEQIAALDLVAPELDPGVPLNASAMDADWAEARDKAMSPHRKDRDRLRGLVVEARVGPGRYPSGHLERVAEVYDGALRVHHHPTKAVAEAFGISVTAAAKQVVRAREQGLLRKTTQGKAAGVSPARKRRTK